MYKNLLEFSFKAIDRVYSILMSRLRVFIYNLHPNITIGKGTSIGKGCLISLQYGGSIKIGRNCILYDRASLITHGGKIQIGDNSSVNPYAVIYGQSKTIIGNGVRIATQTVIVPSNHIFTNTDMPIWKQGLSKKGILIDDDVWIGAGSKILDGVTIKKGCVIGANSVVTKDTESYGIYVGSPAKMIKKRK